MHDLLTPLAQKCRRKFLHYFPEGFEEIDGEGGLELVVEELGALVKQLSREADE